LDNVTFHITPGERIAIVGPSGSGKSTIIELLLRNYDYQSGSIMLDDRELTDLDPRKVRSQIGTSLQDVFLFSDTVRSNIKMAKTNATDGEVKTASETAKIHATIHELPEKYDTHIGEKGVDLSGGQRQRMVLARTFVRKPPILILDDSLSAVDVHTEHEILQELNKKHDDVTVIIVTHRLSCCLNADRILVLEDGKLTKTGVHSELIREEGFYRRLWEIQQEIEQVSDKTELQT
jgi:ATP-binding cassette subfamily B protein